MPQLSEQLKAALAGRYQVERRLGEGGMATVYLAADLKHDRKVALKVLKPELAAVLGADRFVVEIKTTAQLQHPHILPLFDSGNADGFLFYVMPYVEGETLRSRLSRETQLGVEEAVRITREVADALDYAHRHGVIHRDIKPENILLHDGRPVVADFGIALAVSAAAGGRMTETGLSLGTPHYMSPEQATADKNITAKSDIYSVGSVLYEMLTGNPPHVGASAQQIIMKIITEVAEPVTRFRKSVPLHVAAAVAKALEKLPADRFESARAFADALGNPGFTNPTFAGVTAEAKPGLAGWRNPPFLAAAAVAVLAIVVAVAGWLRPEPPRPVTRFGLFLPDSQALNPTGSGARVAISPDGRTIVYVGRREGSGGGFRLWARSLDQLRATPLPGTEQGVNPSFSPDGNRVAFTSIEQPRTIRVVPIGGGPTLTLTDSLVDQGGVSWGTDGYIYYDGRLEGDGIAKIRESGGQPEIATRPDSATGERYHFMPSALPDGRGILMSIARGNPDNTDIGVLDARIGRHKVLTRGLQGRYSPSGHLVFATADGMLMGAPFDLDRLELSGDPVLLADGIAVRGNQRVDLSISAAGTLAYTAGTTTEGVGELVWVSREGVASAVDPAWSGDIVGRLALSPDSRAVAVTLGRGAGRQVWVKQLDRGPATRVAAVGWNPAWAPDGKRLLFSTPGALQTVPADGSSLPVAVRADGSTPSLSPDGRWILFSGRTDVLGARTDGDTATQVLVGDPGIQQLPALSPDQRWLAYASDESGTWQVYVRPFPDTRVAKRQVSVSGGYSPLWSRSGREIFYSDGNSDIWTVDVAPGQVFQAGTPRLLLSATSYQSLSANPFDVAPDGRRFLFSRAVGSAREPERLDELILVQNFFEDLKAKVPRD